VTANNGDMEGIPVAIMEAMASGLPVITTYHSGIPELVENNHSGWLCPERDVHSIVDALIAAIENPNLYSSVAV
ncbi:glycosyltransferase, partial [Klebsiella pneumoniae]|nr:glycosyltransferase [Klebsiella pneumoniae]